MLSEYIIIVSIGSIYNQKQNIQAYASIKESTNVVQDYNVNDMHQQKQKIYIYAVVKQSANVCQKYYCSKH